MAQGHIDRVVSSRTGKVTWRARFSYEDEHGRQHRGKTFKTKREAQDWLTARQHELRSGDYFEPTTVTLHEVGLAWLERRRSVIRSSSWRGTSAAWRTWIDPALGSKQLVRIRPSDVQQLYDEMQAKGISARHVQWVHRVLASIIRSAIADGLIRTDATKDRILPRIDSAPVQVWTAEELTHFLKVTAEDELAVLWKLIASTGLRIGEALALQWSDFDVDGRRLRINKTLRYDYQGQMYIGQNAKTKSSNRTVSVPASTVMELLRQRDTIQRRTPTFGPGTLIFAHPETGSFWHTNLARKAFARGVKRAGLPRLTPHGLRHTAATLLLASGAHPKVVQEQLGHATIGITMDLYGHVTEGMRQAAADLMDAVLGGGNSRVEKLPRQNRVR